MNTRATNIHMNVLFKILDAMNPLKKGQLREENRYMLGGGRSPPPNIYPPCSSRVVLSVHSCD
jgi:hypothetical protein